MMHVVPVSYPFLVLFSMLTTPLLLPIFLHSHSALCFSVLHRFTFVAAIMFISLSEVIYHAFHSVSIYAFLIIHLPIGIHLSFALAYCFALIAVYACCSVSDLHAINTHCSIIYCHFILLVIWFMPVIHSLLVISTYLLFALCLSFSSCSSCHATLPGLHLSFYLCPLSESHLLFNSC